MSRVGAAVLRALYRTGGFLWLRCGAAKLAQDGAAGEWVLGFATSSQNVGHARRGL